MRGPGPGPDVCWPVPVEPAAGGGRLMTFPLVDEALVQSTTRIRRWRRGGRDLHHLVDPATGLPTETGVAAAVVTGPAAGFAEAVAKAAVVAGPAAGIELIARNGLDGWLVLDDGAVRSTPAVEADLEHEHAGAR